MNNLIIQKKPIIIFIMGPTASGKTLIANELYKQLPVDVISVDSVLIYRNMDIGAAKPSLKERELVPYKLIDIRDPRESYSVANFLKDVLLEIKNTILHNRIPLLVGGSMFYFYSLLYGINLLPSANLYIREKIKLYADLYGWDVIHKYLNYIDPIAAIRIHPHDIQRIIRALEIFFISKKTLTELSKLKKQQFPYTVFQFGILPKERNVLFQRIIFRYKEMLKSGFEDEVRNLYNRGDLNENLPAIRSVGYRQMWLYLSGKINYNEMIYRSICATRQLAKRQMTWLNKWNNLHILEMNNTKKNVEKILKIINLY